MKYFDVPGDAGHRLCCISLGCPGCLTAFMTPMATPAVPLSMADGGYDLKTVVKGGSLISLILPVVYIFYVMTVFPAF